MRKAVDVMAVIAGAAALAGGPLIGLALALLVWTGQGREARLQAVTIALALGVIGVGCGSALIWAGIQALRSLPDRPFRLPAWGWWLLACLAALALGQAAGSSGALAALPLLHIAAGVTGAILFLALAYGGARAGISRVGARTGIGSLAWGALGAAGVAMVLELLLILLLVLAAAIWFGAVRPELLAELQNWALQQLQDPSSALDTEALRMLLSSPWLALGALLVLGLAVPLIEETSKSLAVPLAALTLQRPGLTPRHLTALEGYLFGVASGAGFALLEGVLNGSVALAVPGNWGLIMVARVGTASIHCLAAGLGGLAWQSVLSGRHWRRASGLALAAIAIHGLWNVGAGAMALAELSFEPGIPVAVIRLVAAGLMALLWLAVVAALPLIAARLASSADVLAGAADPGPEAYS